ncbi:hypothetical protein CEXT_283581 [Caerostris extrusa]|uniref:Uncharacterized protein n=1 Tax=Caerostris extrusa TaxID=172846 RepID=A0AAV4VWC2_CAEEX|nr:hypothetical protein CEXT_283581 [Caerostris extrusa]
MLEYVVLLLGIHQRTTTVLFPSDLASALDIPNSTSLWHVQQRPDDSLKVSTNSLRMAKNILGKLYIAFYYIIIIFAHLNSVLQFHKFCDGPERTQDSWQKSLPRTDSRLRPDIRMLEQADTEGAATEKNRLEEKQRDARKQRKKKKRKLGNQSGSTKAKVSHIKKRNLDLQQHVLVKRIRGLPGHLLVWQEAGRMEQKIRPPVYLFWLD